jgi:hypothetical protein
VQRMRSVACSVANPLRLISEDSLAVRCLTCSLGCCSRVSSSPPSLQS